MTILIPAWVDGELAPVEKLEVHERGLRHKAVSIFVMDGDRVLLQKRAAGKYHTPGLWTNSCCTHPAWGEAAQDCARRRLNEELGIKGLPLTHRGRVEYRAEVGAGLVEHEVVELFTAPATADVTLDPNPDEVSQTRWMPLPDLAHDVARHPDRYTPWLAIYLGRHADTIFGSARGA